MNMTYVRVCMTLHADSHCDQLYVHGQHFCVLCECDSTFGLSHKLGESALGLPDRPKELSGQHRTQKLTMHMWLITGSQDHRITCG